MCRSVLLIAGYNHVRGNRAGVFRKGVPALLCAGHVEIGRDFEHFLRQHLAEHGGQAGQLHLAVVEEGLDGRDLLQRRGEVDFREHGLNLALGHAAIQKRLDLGEHGDVLGHRAFVHGSGNRVQVFQQRRLFGFRRRAVFAELLGQRVHIGGGFLDVLLLPDGHDHIRQHLCILHRRSPALFGVLAVQLIQRSLFFRRVLDQLNERIFFIIAFINLLIDGGKTFGGSHQRVLVDGHIRVLFPTRLCTGDLSFQLLPDGIEAVHILRGQVILDFNGLAGVDQLLQADFFLFSQEAVLALFQQPLDLRVHLIQRLNVRCQSFRNAGIAVFIGSILERLQFGARAVRQAFEGIRPVCDDLVAFLLAICPDGQQPIQPFLCGLLVLDEILLGHAEEGEALTAPVERLRRCAFPLVGSFLHSLQRLAGLLCSGHIIRNGHGGINGRCGNGQPYGGRTAQHAQKAFDPAACLANRCGKLADAGRDAADALGHLAKEQQYRANRCSDGCILDDLLALGFIHLKELTQQVVRALDQALDGGIQVVADLLSKQQRLVFEVRELAGGGGIAFLRFRGQRGIFLPCGVGHVLRTEEQFGRVGGAEQRIAQANLVDADVRQRLNGAFAFIVQLGQAHNKCLKRGGGIVVPQRLKLLGGHSGHFAEVVQRLAACRGGNLHFDQRFRESGAAHLCLNAHGGKRRCKAQHLCFRKPDLLARACHAVRHFHDRFFGGGKVVAQIHQRRADIGKLALAGAHDVGKLRNGRRSLVRAQVLAGIAEVNHDAGEVGQMLGSNAQLTARRHDLVDLIGARRDLGRHALGRSRQLVKLGFCSVHGFPDRGKRRFKANGSLDCRCAQPQNGRGHDSSQCPACSNHFLADSVALFSEGFEVLACRRPRGFCRVQLLIGFFNLGACGSDGSLGAIQRGFRVNHRIRSLPDFLRIVGLLGGCQLFFRAPQRILILLNALFL